MGEWLTERVPANVPVADMIARGDFVYSSGAAVLADDAYRPHTLIWFYREEVEEPEVPGRIDIVYEDDKILIVDKPPFLATMPRGSHVRQSVVVRLRFELGLPELAPMHRLDKDTSGLLALTKERRWRGAYQSLFERGAVSKTYWALANESSHLSFPITVRNHIAKNRGELQARVIPGLPANSETLIERESTCGRYGLYRLTPRTGKTHQLRVHLSHVGIPIMGDWLYPTVRDRALTDFSQPMQLLAGELSFTDPYSGEKRHWASKRTLPIQSE